MRTFLTPVALLLVSLSPVRAVTLEQVISRETPLHNNLDSELTVGRDGLVTLQSHVMNNAYVMRLSRDGKTKYGGGTGLSTGNVAIDAHGVIAVAKQHFASNITLYDREYHQFAVVDEFDSWTKEFGEASGYRDPARVEVGQSGDFYALDEFKDDIVRLSAAGRALKKYAIPRDGTGLASLTWDFRMSEKAELFYACNNTKNQIRGIGFDGQQKWKTPIDTSGGWDVDDAGTLFAIGPRSDAVRSYGADGKPGKALTLTGNIDGEGDFKSAVQKYPITSMRVSGDDIFVKRAHPMEMFLRFDAATGRLKGAVQTDHETLTVNYPSEVWTAGQAVDFSISHIDPILHAKPQWRVWVRGLYTPEYSQWKLENGKLQVPAGSAGIYQIKVTPEVQPMMHDVPSEYLAHAWVEVRSVGSKGTANLFTPENRSAFARGETVPFAVLLRGAKDMEGKPLPVTIQLRADKSGPVLADMKANLQLSQSSQFSIAASLTEALAPGRYVLSASSPGLTTVAQPLVIGDSKLKSSFFNTMYGDYEQPGFYPNSDAWTTIDLASSHVERQRKLGVNLVVERLGHNVGAVNDRRLQGEMRTLQARLAADPLAVAPDKVMLAPMLLQVVAASGASGISDMPILLYMDAGLPIGSAPATDGRQLPKLDEDITTVTNGLKSYPGFRGWSWVANWWVWNPEKRYADADEKAAYNVALKKAKDTGEWSDVLETVGNRRFSFGIDAEHNFHQLLDTLAPGKVSALSGPYRTPDSYPPLSFAGANEVDLHYQMEQISPPFTSWHNVDYQKRPGKPAWGHPEIWGDTGTGEQILPNLFGMAMRGADGIGLSGKIPNRGRMPEDLRSSYAGTTSVFRSTFNLFHQYGPWLQSLQGNDHVAVVVSGRMAKIDTWNAVGGEYFTRLFEAYQSCLYAHRPASFVFAEDVKLDTLSKFQAVLVVSQTVEFEPALKSALAAVKAKVFYDGSSRETLVKEFAPLGLAFDNLTRDGHSGQDDSDYPRFAGYFMANAKLLSKTLAAVTPPAQTDSPQVLLSERVAEKGSYLWVLNNTLPDLDMGRLWRVAKFLATRIPVSPTIKINAPGKAIYDVFAQKQVALQNGAVVADLRTLPARLYAILPAPIGRVALRGPSVVAEGGKFKWFAQVRDASDKAIASSVPVRLRLLAGENVLEERILASGAAGSSGTMYMPFGMGSAILEATELLSGQTVRLALKSTPAVLPVALDKPVKQEEAAANASGVKFAALPSAPENDFGVRARDIVVAGDGTTAIVNAMGWDENLFGLDVQTGKVKWKNRVGNHFAYGPQSVPGGFAVQGYDLNSAEGYHLYLADSSGKVSRRFALYGLPKGGVNWAWASNFYDRINNFTMPADGDWVASAGDLGLAVWDKGGKLLWSQDWRANRHTVVLVSQGDNTLVVCEAATATAYEAQTGAQKWKINLPSDGAIAAGIASQDGHTLALRTTCDDGRLFIIRGGKIVTSFLTSADDLSISDDGNTVAVLVANLLKVYDVAGGLKWSFGGDDSLHFPRFSRDNARIAVSSESGTISVLSLDGKVLFERDMEALPATAWLLGGDLLLATWNGEVARYDAKYSQVWRSRLQPSGAAKPDADMPSSRISTWPNADAQSAPLTPNLLADTKAIFTVTLNDRAQELKNKAADLTDGKPDAPAQPWISWSNINLIESGWQGPMVMVFDTFRTQIRLTGITFVEDPAHPESWLRDANLEYWDAEKAQWVFGASMLSNSATHTHTFAKPIEAAKFRLVKSATPGVWPVGNIRLGEIVFHGTMLGGSHPDVIAGRPRAVLFDEGDDLYTAMTGLKPLIGDAASGDRSVKIEAGQGGIPQWTPPFGHAMPNWNFPIRENPQPGEYRWLQFAWKGLAPETTGMSLLIGNPFPGGGVNVSVGDYKRNQGVLVSKPVAGPVSMQWKTVRIDLWDLLKKPIALQCLLLNSNGGPAAFDQLVLGRTEADLPAPK